MISFNNLFHSVSLALGCELILDERTGKYPPIYLKDGAFFYPSLNDAGIRSLSIGN